MTTHASRDDSVRRSPAAHGRPFLVLACGATLLVPAGLSGQVARLERNCGAAGGLALPCAAAADIAAIAPARALLVGFGGNPVPGTASTMGYRLPGRPRIGLSARLLAAPIELSTSAGSSRSALATGFNAGLAVGVVDGATAMSTVGGVASIDLIGTLGVVRLPEGAGFAGTNELAWGLGVRFGVIRESFTLPGISVTAQYGRLGSARAGDAVIGATGAAVDLDAMSAFNVTATVGKRVALLGWIAGASWMHHSVDAGVTAAANGGGTARADETISGSRFSAFGSVTWTLMVVGLTAEGGWQSAGNALASGRMPASGAGSGGLFFGIAARLTL